MPKSKARYSEDIFDSEDFELSPDTMTKECFTIKVLFSNIKKIKLYKDGHYELIIK